jgi:hypothetical protein
MKYLIILLVLIVGLVAAQTVSVQKPLICADTKELMNSLVGEDYKEKPIWMGVEKDSALARYSLFVNEETKTWTLIQFDKKTACVLGTGEASTQMFNGPVI